MTPMRTLLFVPAQRESMVEKAHQVPADVICLDLEDAVPPGEKATARGRVRAAIESLKAAGKTVHVRINHLDTGLTKDRSGCGDRPRARWAALPQGPRRRPDPRAGRPDP